MTDTIRIVTNAKTTDRVRLVLTGTPGPGGPAGPSGAAGAYILSGLSTSNAATTTAALNAAIASFSGGPGKIIAPPSPAGTPWLFQGLIDFLNTDLVGAGGSFAQSATIFQATNSSAQFRFSGGGSYTGGFKLSGNSIAYTPFSRRTSVGGSAGRHFADILVQANADNPLTPRFLDAHAATAVTLQVVNGTTVSTGSLTSFGAMTAASLQSTLRGLSNVGGSNATVTSDEATGGPFTITFSGSAASATLSVTASTGGTGPTIVGTNPLCEFVTSQNDLFEMFVANNAISDLMYFDGGYGGAVFVNSELSTYGRYGIYTDNLIAGGTVYTCPADIEFNGGRIEGSCGRSTLKLGSISTGIGPLGGYNIKFDGFDFFTTNVPTGPLLDIYWGYQITIRSSGIQVTGLTALQTGTVGIRMKNTSFLTLMDRISWTNTETCLSVVDNATFVDDKATNYYVRVSNKILASGSATTAQVGAYMTNGVATNMLGSAQTAIAHYTATKSALYYVQLASGQQKWYPGTGFTPDVIMDRRGAAQWGVSNGGQAVVTGSGARGSEFGTGSAGVAGALYVDTTNGAMEFSDGTNWKSSTPYGIYHPSEQGLLACTFDPMLASQTPLQLTVSAINWVRCKIPAGAAITNLTIQIGTGGAGSAVTQGFLGVYDTSGNLLGTTANQTTAWQSVGRKTHALVTPIAASTHDREVVLVMYAVATTLPKFLYNGGSGVPDFGGQSAASYVAGQITGQVGLSALPSTITLSSGAVWFKYLIGVT